MHPNFYSCYWWKPLASCEWYLLLKIQETICLGSHLLTSSWWSPWATGFSVQGQLLYPGAEELDFKGRYCFQFSFSCLARAWPPETCKKLMLSAGPLEGQTPSRSPRGISVLADCVEMNVEGPVQILVATRRGETSFYKQMPSSYNTADKLHTSCEASGAPELVTESPVTLVFASPSVWEEGKVERGGLEMAERWYPPSSPFWEDLGMKGTY